MIETRAAVDEEIRCAICRNQMKTDRGCDGNCRVDEILHKEIIQIIEKHLSPVQPEPKWIPCSETVDIPDHEVMACDRYGEFIIGYLDCKDEQWLCESDDSLMYNPVAWCELPKPYREGGVDVR